MIRIAWDLELHNEGGNAECGEIIQLGWCIFNTATNDILEVGGNYVITNKQLSEYIIKLTGITEQTISEQGVSLGTAYLNMLTAISKYKQDNKIFIQPVCWGDDVTELRQELETQYKECPWSFGRNFCNLKAMYQFMSIAKQKKHQAGLTSALKNMGLRFEPWDGLTKHNAMADAYNTARLYLAIQRHIHVKED